MILELAFVGVPLALVAYWLGRRHGAQHARVFAQDRWDEGRADGLRDGYVRGYAAGLEAQIHIPADLN